MKRTILHSTCGVLIAFIALKTGYSQSSTVGHIGIAPLFSWCGYTNNALDFHLEHRGTQDINFLTGGTQRMTILGTSAGPTAGNVGIGNFTTPNSLLHVNGGAAAWPALTVQGTDPASGVDGLRMIASGRQYNIGVGGAANGGVANSLFIWDNNAGQFRMVIDQNGYMGLGLTNPDFPLTIMGDANNTMANGWSRGIRLTNNASLLWDRSNNFGNHVYFGHPDLGPSASFYCGLVPDYNAIAGTNYVFRVVDVPIAGQTSNTSGDVEFFWNTMTNGNLGVGLNPAGNVNTTFNATNRVEINTTASTVNPVAPLVIAPNAQSGANVPNVGGGTGFSGLRFTDLRSTSIPYSTSPSNGVLSVDANGDVIMVPAGGQVLANNGLSLDPLNINRVQLGQDINAAANPASLLNYREIPMNSNNLYFLGQNVTPGVNSVGVGFDPNIWPLLPAKLGALDEAGVGLANGRTATFGWNRNFANSANNQEFAGVTGIADGQETFVNKIFHYGGLFLGQHSPVSIGVYGKVQGTDPIMVNNYAGRFAADVNHGNADNIGVLATSINGALSTGGYFDAQDGTTQTTGINVNSGNTFMTNQGIIIGGQIRAQTLPSMAPGCVGLQVVIDQDNTQTNFPSGFFDGGDVVTTFNFVAISDSCVKKNITDFNNGLDIINQLNSVKFEFKRQELIDTIGLPDGEHIGFLAQQVEQVIPELVKVYTSPAMYDTAGNITRPSFSYKGLNYVELIPILIDGVQEQQNMIDQQDSIIDSLQQQMNNQALMMQNMQQQLNDLSALINNCCSNGNLLVPGGNGNNNQTNYIINETNVTLKDEYCFLGNPGPNPFSTMTTIEYELGANVKSAQVVFYNNLGQIIQTTELSQRGKGRLNIFGEELHSGMYSYTLIVDGISCETKKLIKQ